MTKNKIVKRTKKINHKLEKLREEELHTTIHENFVTNADINFFDTEFTLEELKSSQLTKSEIDVMVSFVKDTDKTKTRYLFYTNSFGEKYKRLHIEKKKVFAEINFTPSSQAERVTLSVTKDAIFYNINTYTLEFKKHLYLSKKKPSGFVFDFKTGKLKLYQGDSIKSIYSQNKKAFLKMLSTLGLEFISDEMLNLDWVNRIALEKAIKYSITSPKDIIKEKLRYSSVEYTEHTASLLYKCFSINKIRNSNEFIRNAISNYSFQDPVISYQVFVQIFSQCTNIDHYLGMWIKFSDSIESLFETFFTFGTSRVGNIISSKNNDISSIYVKNEEFRRYCSEQTKDLKTTDYNILNIPKTSDFRDLTEQCRKLGKKINLSWSEKRISSFHNELSWEIMEIEAKTLVDESYYEDEFETDEVKKAFTASNIFSGLELITTKRRLFMEGATQKHCVFTNYEYKVKTKNYVVFSGMTISGERFTVGCKIKLHHEPVIQQLNLNNGVGVLNKLKHTEHNKKHYCLELDQVRLKRNENLKPEDYRYIQDKVEDENFQREVLNYIGLSCENVRDTYDSQNNIYIADNYTQEEEVIPF